MNPDCHVNIFCMTWSHDIQSTSLEGCGVSKTKESVASKDRKLTEQIGTKAWLTLTT